QRDQTRHYDRNRSCPQVWPSRHACSRHTGRSLAPLDKVGGPTASRLFTDYRPMARRGGRILVGSLGAGQSKWKSRALHVQNSSTLTLPCCCHLIRSPRFL